MFNLKKRIEIILQNRFFPFLDGVFRSKDRSQIQRTKNITRIPGLAERRGGKTSYAEWAHVIGIFQVIIYENLINKNGNHILDIGCGTGLLGIAAEPYTTDGGSYTGIDVIKKDINFCREHYKNPEQFKFIHFDVANPSYAASQPAVQKKWPVGDDSYDMVTALSVWTHLREEDALFYFKEIARVLKTGGRAVITFFYLDGDYITSNSKRSETNGRYHNTRQDLWIFNKAAYGSDQWLTTAWSKHPEDAIGVNAEGMKKLLDYSGLKLIRNYPGNWKEIPGVYFQDVLIFEK